jgi:hypothetical protein
VRGAAFIQSPKHFIAEAKPIRVILNEQVRDLFQLIRERLIRF